MTTIQRRITRKTTKRNYLINKQLKIKQLWKKYQSKKQKNDLIAIFGAVSLEEFRKRKEHLSWYSDNDNGVTFFIDKNVTERGEVFKKLQEYFEERVIKGGYCTVSPITLVWTSFELKKGKPNTL